MKCVIAVLMLFSLVFVAQAQTNLRTVMVDTNGVVQRPTNFIATNRIVSVATNGTVATPTNFWTANSNFINSVVSNSSSTFNSVDLIYKVQQYFFGPSIIESNNAFVTIASSLLEISIAATNTNASGGARLINSVNSRSSGGVGTLFGNDSHTAWLRFESVPRENSLVRFILGTPSNPSTNIAAYPTNRAFGFELRSISASLTNEVRLIAHNGTTNTNGPWVAIGDIFQDYTIGAKQNKTNGEINLFVGSNQGVPTVNTNATIFGGPTNNAGGGQSALEIGMFTTNTNSASVNVTVHGALVEITD